jgi:hypothetical protein
MVAGDFDAADRVDDAKDLEQPDDHADDDNAVEQGLDAAGHGDVAVDETEDHTDDDEVDDDVNQIHLRSVLWVNDVSCLRGRTLDWVGRLVDGMEIGWLC